MRYRGLGQEVDFNAGKTQLVSFDWSDNTGAIDVNSQTPFNCGFFLKRFLLCFKLFALLFFITPCPLKKEWRLVGGGVTSSNLAVMVGMKYLFFQKGVGFSLIQNVDQNHRNIKVLANFSDLSVMKHIEQLQFKYLLFVIIQKFQHIHPC